MRKGGFKTYQGLALISQIGISMALYIIGAVLLGNYIDNFFNSSPLALLVCLLLGIAAAFYNIFKLLFKVADKNKDDDPWKK